MANQVLRCAGHSSQCLRLLHVIKPIALHALFVDVNTLYRLFCSESTPQQMAICSFKNVVIQQESVDSHKDVVFSAFFSNACLARLSASCGSQFANILRLLPGLNMVRVHGTIERLSYHPRQASWSFGDPTDDDNVYLQQQPHSLAQRQ